MASKTDVEVNIGGKALTISGHESEEYLQHIAAYINKKLSEYTRVESFARQPNDIQNVLIQLNIADDYFKAKDRIAQLEEDLEGRDREIYDLKHDAVSYQMQLEEANRKAVAKEQEHKLEMLGMESKLVGLQEEIAQLKGGGKAKSANPMKAAGHGA